MEILEDSSCSLYAAIHIGKCLSLYIIHTYNVLLSSICGFVFLFKCIHSLIHYIHASTFTDVLLLFLLATYIR